MAGSEGEGGSKESDGKEDCNGMLWQHILKNRRGFEAVLSVIYLQLAAYIENRFKFRPQKVEDFR